MSDRLDCVVVGAGVVGLAVARSLALTGREVVVLEAEPEIGMHTSSRNSEVIHAGIYYPEKSLKAQLCVQGRDMLYRYCNERNVAHEQLGKMIVASHEDELPRLREIRLQATRNGVDDLRMISGQEAKSLEPNVQCELALLSPSTGIIDSHSLMISMQADIEACGGVVVTNSRVACVRATDDGFTLNLEGVQEKIGCNLLVNSTGLYAERFATCIDGFESEYNKKIRFAIGHYFSYQGKSPFNHLIYPLPVDGGLGIHATNDMGGSARFGPDVTWIEDIDYAFDESKLAEFAESIEKYFPGVDARKLTPAYTGIRPKISGPNDSPQDFVIQGETVHGISGLVNLYGIESPGLTSSLAIGDYVAELLQ